jgi:hypothetical protein
MNETHDADIIDRAKTELRDLLAIVAPHLTPMDTLSGLISQINNVLAWMRDQIPKTTNEGRALPDAPKDGPWAWAIVDPNERLRSQDGEPVETLITWCGVAADSFLSDAIEAMNEGDAEPYIVPLYPREQPAPPAELAALRAECDKAWAEIDERNGNRWTPEAIQYSRSRVLDRTAAVVHWQSPAATERD